MFSNYFLFHTLYDALAATSKISQTTLYYYMYQDFYDCTPDCKTPQASNVSAFYNKIKLFNIAILKDHVHKFSEFCEKTTSDSDIEILADYDYKCEEHFKDLSKNFIKASKKDEYLDIRTCKKILKEIYNDPQLPEEEKKYIRENTPNLQYKNKEETLCLFFAQVINLALRTEAKIRIKQPIPVKSGSIGAGIISNYSAPFPCGSFRGRDTELSMIHDYLVANSHLFICSESGIGKSELAKAYVHKYKTAVKYVIYVNCSGDLYHDIENLQLNTSPSFLNNCSVLNSLGSKLLLVIDNCEECKESSTMDALLNLNCRILFTSISPYPGVNHLTIKPLEDSILRSFFNQHLLGDKYQLEYIDRIIQYFGKNTNAVQSLATLANEYAMLPSDLYDQICLLHFEELDAVNGSLLDDDISSFIEKIKGDGYIPFRDTAFSLRKDNKTSTSTFPEHVFAPLSEITLDAENIRIIKNLLLIPPSGIPVPTFKELLNIRRPDCLYYLKTQGIIQESDGKLSITKIAHSFYFNKYLPTITDCKDMLIRIDSILETNPTQREDTKSLLAIILNAISYTKKDDLDFYLDFLLRLAKNETCSLLKNVIHFINAEIMHLLESNHASDISPETVVAAKLYFDEEFI